MQKAAREAKLHTSWVRVNEPYEAADDRVHPRAPRRGTRQRLPAGLPRRGAPVTWIGYLNRPVDGRDQVHLAGVPDCYQGNELWDFSLVDPGQPRPVDYAKRARMLEGWRHGRADERASPADLPKPRRRALEALS
jgi:(1->4)-alpha-D-glucan 1-alpha-D-glucosylmutase